MAFPERKIENEIAQHKAPPTPQREIIHQPQVIKAWDHIRATWRKKYPKRLPEFQH